MTSEEDFRNAWAVSESLDTPNPKYDDLRVINTEKPEYFNPEQDVRVLAMNYAQPVSPTIEELLANADKIWAWLKTGQVAENDGPADSESL